MATKKVTITLDVEQLDAIRSLIETRAAKSVLAFVQHAVNVSLGDVAGWGASLAEALGQSGGPLTRAERRWADGIVLARGHKRAKKRGKAAGAV